MNDLMNVLLSFAIGMITIAVLALIPIFKIYIEKGRSGKFIGKVLRLITLALSFGGIFTLVYLQKFIGGVSVFSIMTSALMLILLFALAAKWNELLSNLPDELQRKG